MKLYDRRSNRRAILEGLDDALPDELPECFYSTLPCGCDVCADLDVFELAVDEIDALCTVDDADYCPFCHGPCEFDDGDAWDAAWCAYEEAA